MKPIIEELERRPNLPAVAPKWLQTVAITVMLVGMSILAFNAGV